MSNEKRICHPEHFGKKPGLMDFIAYLSDSSEDEILDAYHGMPEGQRYIIGVFASFIHSGRQIFDVGPALSECFGQMSLGNVTPDMLFMPYETFYVTGLPDRMPERAPGGYDLSHRDSFYVSYVQGVWTLTVVGYDRPSNGEMWNLAPISIVESRWRESGLDLDAYIEANLRYMCDPNVFDLEEASIIVRRFAHLLLYLSSEGAETELHEPGKLRRLENKVKNAATDREKRKFQKRLDRITLLRRTKLAPSLEADFVSTDDRESPSRHWVRGHWKRQRHGEGRKLTKIIQVWPYLRGEGDDPEGTRTYSIKEPNYVR